jgi:hypothetical protein
MGWDAKIVSLTVQCEVPPGAGTARGEHSRIQSSGTAPQSSERLLFDASAISSDTSSTYVARILVSVRRVKQMPKRLDRLETFRVIIVEGTLQFRRGLFQCRPLLLVNQTKPIVNLVERLFTGPRKWQAAGREQVELREDTACLPRVRAPLHDLLLKHLFQLHVLLRLVYTHGLLRLAHVLE